MMASGAKSSREDVHRKGDEAARLLSHPLLNDTFDKLVHNYLEEALKLKPEQDLERFRLMEAVRVVRSVRSHLSSMVTTGKLARRKAVRMEP